MLSSAQADRIQLYMAPGRVSERRAIDADESTEAAVARNAVRTVQEAVAHCVVGSCKAY